MVSRLSLLIATNQTNYSSTCMYGFLQKVCIVNLLLEVVPDIKVLHYIHSSFLWACLSREYEALECLTWLCKVELRGALILSVFLYCNWASSGCRPAIPHRQGPTTKVFGRKYCDSAKLASSWCHLALREILSSITFSSMSTLHFRTTIFIIFTMIVYPLHTLSIHVSILAGSMFIHAGIQAGRGLFSFAKQH